MEVRGVRLATLIAGLLIVSAVPAVPGSTGSGDLETFDGFLGVADIPDGPPTAVFDGPVPPAVRAVAAERGLATHAVDRGEMDTLERELSGDPVPVDPEEGIGPGSEMRIELPNGDAFGCTANFIWEDAEGELYLGTAGHCLLPGDATATHGPDADYDASRVTVQVAAEGCVLKPSTFAAEVVTCTTKEGPVWLDLGDVVYARQGEVGHDFGLVEIPADLEPRLRTQMPYWGGPNGSDAVDLDEPVLHYGHGLGYAAHASTRRRAGEGLGPDPLSDGWMAFGTSHQGDSGSAVVDGHRTGEADLFDGEKAVGILTHGRGTLVVGAFLGTSVEQAKADAACFAGLQVRVVPNGSLPPSPGEDCADDCPSCPDPCPDGCPGDDGSGNGTEDGGLPTVYLEGAGEVDLPADAGDVRKARLVANASFSVADVDRPGLPGTGVLVAPDVQAAVQPDRCTGLPDGTTAFFGPPSASGRLWSVDHPAGDYVVRWAAAEDVDLTLELDRDGPTRAVDGSTTNGSVRFVEPAVDEQSGTPSRATFETAVTPENASLVMADFKVLPFLDAGNHEMRQSLEASRTCDRASRSDLSVSTPAGWYNAPETWLAGVVPGSATATWTGVYEQTVGVWKPTDPVIDETYVDGIVMELP